MNRKNKITFNLFLIIIVSGIITIAFFFSAYHLRYNAMNYFIDRNGIKVDTAAYLKKFRTKAADVYIRPKTYGQKAALKKLLNTRSYYQTIIITDVDNDDIIKATSAKVLNNYIVGSYLTEDDIDFVTYEKSATVKFKDQKAIVYIESYSNAKFLIPYLIIMVLISLFIFLLPILRYVAKKMNYINKINEDIDIIASGNLGHEIVLKGNDEITNLASEIDHLRNSLVSNIEKEQETREKNRELITSLSHDIRSPLTSLKGYMEILRLHKYKSDEQLNKYLNTCNNKIDEINELSNKIFEYFMVYDENKIYELICVDMNYLKAIIIEHIEYLNIKGFDTTFDVQDSNCTIMINEQLIRRIFSNLFSNITKYADKNYKITITIENLKQNLSISFMNIKTTDTVKESNNIGLKSVKKMLGIMNGDLYIHNNQSNFIAIVNLPIRGKDAPK